MGKSPYNLICRLLEYFWDKSSISIKNPPRRSALQGYAWWPGYRFYVAQLCLVAWQCLGSKSEPVIGKRTI